MERNEGTFTVDEISHYNNENETHLLLDGEEVIGRWVYTTDLNLDGNVTVSLGEHFTTITGDMKVTVSWVEGEWEGEEYTEDYCIESVEVME